VIVESTPECGVERMSYLLEDGSNYKLLGYNNPQTCIEISSRHKVLFDE
jgi:hypothetical protein